MLHNEDINGNVFTRIKPRLEVRIGMFTFTGMTPEQVATCTRDYDCNGSLRISDELISKHWPGNKTIYSSSSLLAAGFNVV